MSTATDGVRVDPVADRAELDRFIKFPYRIYEDDALWVAPLLIDVRKAFDPEKHPFYEHSEVQPFIATRDGEVVGRIAAINNRNHVAFHDESVGFFGWFECVDDQQVADALFEAAAAWLRERDLETMRGPVSHSTNEVTGLLIEGFEYSPAIMMPYNPPYYADLIENAGYTEAKTLVAYDLKMESAPDYITRIEDRLRKRLGVHIRSIRMDRFEEELGIVRQVYNAAWETNWGFVPMTDAELDFMAHELKAVVKKDPDLVFIVEDSDGNPIGFSLTLRDYNQAIKHAKGRLFPFGLLKILWHARDILRVRVLTLGIVPGWRGKGLDNLMYLRVIRVALARGIDNGEFSWCLEDNVAIRRPLEKLGSQVYKRYRLYDRPT